MLEAKIHHKFSAIELNLEFSLASGTMAFFGPSGSGKTSVINILSGLLKADRAKVTFEGETLQDDGVFVPAHKRPFAVVFQDARLFPHMSVAQNLDYGARFRKASSGTRDEVIDLLNLGGLLTRAPNTLSGGEAQRVAIGRALLSGPRLLLMDEPLASLDAPRKAEILPYLERLKKDAGLPILYVSHAMEEVARLADDLVLLKDGQIKAQGPLFEVLSDPVAIPLVGVRDSGAVIEARVIAHAADGVSELATSAGTLHLPGVSAAIGETIRLRVLASDVILSLDDPVGLSALNVLPVEVTAIQGGQGPGAAVVLKAGQDQLLARVTGRSVERLALKPGLRCFAILKAMAVAPAAIGR